LLIGRPRRRFNMRFGVFAEFDAEPPFLDVARLLSSHFGQSLFGAAHNVNARRLAHFTLQRSHCAAKSCYRILGRSAD